MSVINRVAALSRVKLEFYKHKVVSVKHTRSSRSVPCHKHLTLMQAERLGPASPDGLNTLLRLHQLDKVFANRHI